MRRFTEIKGLSETRRLPRIGRVRLGIRVKKKTKDDRCKHGPEDTCFFCTYPRETSWFVVPEEVEKVYGKQPTELDIMLPVNDAAVIFPQALEYYGASRGLKCTGDRKTALRMNEDTKTMERRDCPCEFLDQGKCVQRGHLAVILFKVSVGGIYQIDTASFNSIVDINSSLAYIEAMIGRFAMVPLKLKRNPIETFHGGKRQTHYTMRIELEGDIDFVNKLIKNTGHILAGPTYSLPAPVQDESQYDGETAVEDTNGDQAEAPASVVVEPPTTATEPTVQPTKTVYEQFVLIIAGAKDPKEWNSAKQKIQRAKKGLSPEEYRKLIGLSKDRRAELLKEAS